VLARREVLAIVDAALRELPALERLAVLLVTSRVVLTNKLVTNSP
jgi:hypothetical protein